jgi:hypothetical protein
MNFISRSLVALSVAGLFVASPSTSQAEPVARFVPDFTVFVDPPTGFVFLKLPTGWKFVGKVEANDVGRLPVGVVTALLTGDDDTPGAGQLALTQPR